MRRWIAHLRRRHDLAELSEPYTLEDARASHGGRGFARSSRTVGNTDRILASGLGAEGLRYSVRMPPDRRTIDSESNMLLRACWVQYSQKELNQLLRECTTDVQMKGVCTDWLFYRVAGQKAVFRSPDITYFAHEEYLHDASDSQHPHSICRQALEHEDDPTSYQA